MRNLFTKKAMIINFKKNNKNVIAYKRKKEKLIFISLIKDIYAQNTY